MTVDVMQQARAMCQGLLLGGGLGVLYDLLRVCGCGADCAG